jgi:SAM-dependent methyltransferase
MAQAMNMQPKPKHLGPEYASVFQDASVVAAYPNRPPCPRGTIEFLAGLAVDEPRIVLDVGCGTGDIARPLAPLVSGVDAVDISAGMIELGKRLPGGDNPAIRWIQGAVEEVPLEAGYALITAGDSLHWMEWSVVMPRFARLLTPRGVLAIINRDWESVPALWERVLPIIQRHGTNRDFRPYSLRDELTSRGLFQPVGHHEDQWVPWEPTIEEYIEMRHSQNGLSRERMRESAPAFDGEVREAIEELIASGAVERRGDRLQLAVRGQVLWGKPIESASVTLQ